MNAFLFQLMCYFTGIAFSTGGGNLPGQESTQWIYLKAFLILTPIIGFGWHLAHRPLSSFDTLIALLKKNAALVLYFMICLVVLPFAVNWEYSLIRLSYSLVSIAGLCCLLAQFALFPDNAIRTTILENTVYALSIISVLFCLGIWVKNGFSFHDFRFGVQKINVIHPNILASFFAMLCVWYAVYWVHGHKKAWIGLVVFALLEYALFSRTAFLALAAIIVSYPFLLLWLERSKKALIGCLGIGFGLSLAAFLMITRILPAEVFLTPFLRQDTVSSLMTLTNRTVLWQQLLDQVTAKVFFLGHGYSVIAPHYGIDMGTGILYGAHNAFLSVLLGSGIFALLAVMSYFLLNIKRLLKQRYGISREILLIVLCSHLVFFITCFSSEEIGVTVSINLAYLLFLTNGVVLSCEQEPA